MEPGPDQIFMNRLLKNQELGILTPDLIPLSPVPLTSNFPRADNFLESSNPSMENKPSFRHRPKYY